MTAIARQRRHRGVLLVYPGFVLLDLTGPFEAFTAYRRRSPARLRTLSASNSLFLIPQRRLSWLISLMMWDR